MPTALFEPIAVGDQRPITVEVSPSDNGRVSTATYRIVRRKDPPGTIWDTGGTCQLRSVTCGFRISTPVFITFPTADVYTIQFCIVWDDHQIDNTVCAVVPVHALCSYR